MPRVYIIRVGMDSAYGGFVSPFFEEDESFIFIPIHSSRCRQTYSQCKTNNKDVNLLDWLPKDGINRVGTKIPVDKLHVHNDPEFITNTYGEMKDKLNGRMWNILKSFQKGDYVIFYATFCPWRRSDKYGNYTLAELQRLQAKQKRYYIIAVLRLACAPIVKENYKQHAAEVNNNAHITSEFPEDDFIVKGDESSGWLKNPIRIDSGEIIGGNYQANEEFMRFKFNNKRGLNRLYSELKPETITCIMQKQRK